MNIKLRKGELSFPPRLDRRRQMRLVLLAERYSHISEMMAIVRSVVTCIPIDERGVFRYSSALDTSTALSHVWTEVWLPIDACLLPAADSMAMVTALVLSRLSTEPMEL